MGSHVTVSQYNSMESSLIDEIDLLKAKNKVLKNHHKEDIKTIHHTLLWMLNGYCDKERLNQLIENLNYSLHVPLISKKDQKKEEK